MSMGNPNFKQTKLQHKTTRIWLRSSTQDGKEEIRETTLDGDNRPVQSEKEEKERGSFIFCVDIETEGGSDVTIEYIDDKGIPTLTAANGDAETQRRDQEDLSSLASKINLKKRASLFRSISNACAERERSRGERSSTIVDGQRSS